VKLAKTAIDCSFTHVSMASGLKFKQSLKHRHSGMFLAGMTIKWGCSGVIVYI